MCEKKEEFTEEQVINGAAEADCPACDNAKSDIEQRLIDEERSRAFDEETEGLEDKIIEEFEDSLRQTFYENEEDILSQDTLADAIQELVKWHFGV